MRDQEIVGLWEAYHQVYAPQKNSEEVELWVNQLVEEGYDLSEYTWDDMVEIHEDQMLNGTLLTKHGFTPENRRDWKEMVRKYGPEPITNPRPTGKGQSRTRSASKVSNQSSEAPKRKRRTNLSDVQIKENRGERDHGERYGSHEQGPPINHRANRARGRAYDAARRRQEAAEREAQRNVSEHILAAQYFYEMGLNEEGVNILIEELGVSQFANFVYDIAEESLLMEARAGGSRIEPKLASGKAIEGKPKAATLKRLRAQKEARREAEEKASAAKPSGLKASLQRQSAIANAKKEQPKKKGVLDRIAGAVLAGMERDKAAREKLGKAARETGAVIQKAAKGAGHVAREFGSGMSTAAKVGKRVVTGEEVELWVNQLVEEGYDLSEYTWDDMYEIYLDEAAKRTPKKVRGAKDPEAYMAGRSDAGKRISGDEKTGPVHYTLGRRGSVDSPTQPNERPVNTPKVTKDELNFARMAHSSSSRRVGGRKGLPENYNVILTYLLDEGYADTLNDANVIIKNMSEGWMQSIVEFVSSSTGTQPTSQATDQGPNAWGKYRPKQTPKPTGPIKWGNDVLIPRNK